jgi:hypothetical protein
MKRTIDDFNCLKHRIIWGDFILFDPTSPAHGKHLGGWKHLFFSFQKQQLEIVRSGQSVPKQLWSLTERALGRVCRAQTDMFSKCGRRGRVLQSGPAVV